MASVECKHEKRAVDLGPRSVPPVINASLSEAVDAFEFGWFQVLLAAGLGIALIGDSMEIMI